LPASVFNFFESCRFHIGKIPRDNTHTLTSFLSSKYTTVNKSQKPSTSREVRRRNRVIGVVPTVDSYVRLVTCCLVEYSEDWGSDRSYIKQEKILAALEQSREILAAQGAN
jgi:transposase-like protein